MPETDRPGPMFVNLHEDGTTTLVEVPDFNELLGERISGMQSDTRAFLKLQILVRDQDVIGMLFRPPAIIEMVEDLVAEGTLTPEHAIDLFDAAKETHDAFREETFREAQELGVPRPDPSKPDKLQ